MPRIRAGGQRPPAIATPDDGHQTMLNRKLKTTLQEQQAELAARQAVIDAIDRTTARIEFAPDGTVLFANELFLATMKYRSEDVLGKNHRMFCEAGYANSSDYLAHWQRLRRGEPVSGRFERRDASGEPVWLEATYNPVFGPDGRVLRVVKLATDISTQVREGAERRAMLSAIERSMAMIEFDLDGKVLAANDNFLATMGYARGEVLGRHHRLFCAAEDAEAPDYARFWERLRHGEYFSGRFRRVARNGRTVWLEASYNRFSTRRVDRASSSSSPPTSAAAWRRSRKRSPTPPPRSNAHATTPTLPSAEPT